ncbi:tyrosine-type recombinase/integrase [Halobacillus sp. A5]|uniref:tyrosine-type recombinase/integrase n=1 Tax=Halobacillus sp. A5 TaxID=2880263 RepID=UPI0020A633D9|nr:tyrosine-type recombinase/integrase [Halobacillus sp. A5]MCP3026905.1 tyrosine-type recombinase/integrase [Halobacillus sp. A5]
MPNQVKDVQPIRDKEVIEDMKWSLRRHCGERDYILFILGINTGLRVGDMLRLRVKDVRYKKRVKIKEGKTNKPRVIYLDSVYEDIQAYVKGLDSEWLFPSRKGDKAISTTQAYRALNKAGVMVDIEEGIGTHTMRKTFGYWYYKKHLNMASLQSILNHTHPDITKRYIGITEEEIEESLADFKL